jgi:predicted aldo/keto reductase-like oxidoreductase
MSAINRRKFFSRIGSGTLACGAFGFLRNPMPAITGSSDEETKEYQIVKYNELGKTGLKVSDISFGAAGVFSEDVIRYAFDLGVNLFDTAESYQKGKSEEIVGQGLKGVRNKAYIVTKYNLHRHSPKKISAVTERVEKSLKRLQTDYIDIFYPYHGLNNPAQIKNDIVIEATEKLKKEGKIRFTGLSTHNAKDVLAECIKPEYSSFIQVVLFIYNHIDGKPIEHAVKQLRNSGIGTIAMKSQAGGKQGNIKSFVNKKQTYEVAALKWVLGNPSIHTTVISMQTFSHVEAYIKASGQKLKRDDLMVLNEYRKKVDKIYCRLECDTCEASCPGNVAISDIMRFAMYFEDYMQEQRAIEAYQQLGNSQRPLLCHKCSGFCNQACPYRLGVKEKLISINNILS